MDYMYEYMNQKIASSHMNILLYISVSYITPMCVLSDTYAYAFAKSPGVRVCHADYALGSATVLCNVMHIV